MYIYFLKISAVKQKSATRILFTLVDAGSCWLLVFQVFVRHNGERKKNCDLLEQFCTNKFILLICLLFGRHLWWKKIYHLYENILFKHIFHKLIKELKFVSEKPCGPHSFYI